MSNARFLRVLLPCVLFTASACGDDATTQPTDDTADPAGEGEGHDDAGLDGGAKTGGKLDGGTKPTGTSDASVESDAGAIKSDAGVTSGIDGGAKADASVPPPVATLKPKCMKKDSQLIIVGDSYINYEPPIGSHDFPGFMTKASGQTWRLNAIPGASMVGGLIPNIPSQFDSAIAADPDAHTVLMDGGGNDILLDPLSACKDDTAPTMQYCQDIVTNAIKAADVMMTKAVAAGIRDVVYFFYPHVPKNRPIGGANPNAILDYALPKVRDFCDGVEAKTSGKLRCHFVDMVPVFDGHDPDWFNGDIHENNLGAEAMANKIWQVMTDQCIGQKSGATCCEP